MAQTTGALTMTNAYVAISTASSTTGWFDASGYANKIEPGPMTRAVGAVFTYSGDIPIIKGGKRGDLDIKLSFVYTEEATGPFKLVLGQYNTAGGGSLWVKWCPKNSTTGDYIYTTDAGVITSVTLPQGDPDKGEPIAVGFTIKVPQVTQGTSA